MTPEEEQEIREWLWLNHGCPMISLYGDDGEMQCAGTGKHILDFKRQPLLDLIKIVFSNYSGGDGSIPLKGYVLINPASHGRL